MSCFYVLRTLFGRQQQAKVLECTRLELVAVKLQRNRLYIFLNSNIALTQWPDHSGTKRRHRLRVTKELKLTNGNPEQMKMQLNWSQSSQKSWKTQWYWRKDFINVRTSVISDLKGPLNKNDKISLRDIRRFNRAGSKSDGASHLHQHRRDEQQQHQVQMEMLNVPNGLWQHWLWQYCLFLKWWYLP